MNLHRTSFHKLSNSHIHNFLNLYNNIHIRILMFYMSYMILLHIHLFYMKMYIDHNMYYMMYIFYKLYNTNPYNNLLIDNILHINHHHNYLLTHHILQLQYLNYIQLYNYMSEHYNYMFRMLNSDNNYIDLHRMLNLHNYSIVHIHPMH